MKIYKKSKDTFLFLSILTLLMSIGSFHYGNPFFGNFLLGLFASSVIVYIQSRINYKIELSRIVIPFLKTIDNSLFDIKFIIRQSLEHSIIDFPDNYYEIKDSFEKLNSAIFEVSDIKSLNKRNKKLLNIMKTEVINLEKKIYLIFKYFDDSTKEEKRYLFIHLYNTLKDFDFDYIENINFKLADKVDFEEYLSRSPTEKSDDLFGEMERKESKRVYIESIKNQNKIEYKALKSDFDLFDNNFKK